MASLRRIASLDRELRASSNPGSCIRRQSSLPNLFLGQPELSMKARNKLPTSRKSPHSFDSPSLHSHSLRSQPRALSTHSYGDFPLFEVPMYAGCGSRGFQRKEALLAAGKQSLDLEKSIVYNELKGSMWKFEAPSTHIEGSPCAGIYTHIHTHRDEDSYMPAKNPDLHIGNHVRGRPLSLQMLKRKLSQQAAKPSRSAYRRQLNEKCPPWRSVLDQESALKAFADAGDPVSSAFASLFFIMQMLQQCAHSLRMRCQPSVLASDDSGYDSLVGRACAEMLDSLLWLFQQVFSCTPGLMLLTMVLLADFALHSLSIHVALIPVTPSKELQSTTMLPFKRSPVAKAMVMDDAHMIYHPGSGESSELRIVPSKSKDKLLHTAHRGGGVNVPGHARVIHQGANAAKPRLPQTADCRPIVDGDDANDAVTLSSLHHVHQSPRPYRSGRKEIDLDVLTKHAFVAPVHAPALEADDYPCFDRTDLAYQHEISEDPINPLLLANYAQFLHLVRHDYGRAEELYKRAVRADADTDGEVMGRFASFLWVAKGNVAEAERTYKAAVMADPTNAFLAGNYAHFLWNSSAGQAEEVPCCIIDNMNNTSQHIPNS